LFGHCNKFAGERRLLLWSAIAGMGAAGAAGAAPKRLEFGDLKKEADVNVLYHCDFGDQARFGQMLNNVNNHLSVYEFDPFKAKIVIVTHAAGVKYFLKDLAGTPWEKETINPDLAARMDALAKCGVEVYICEITFKRLKIDMAKLRDDPYLRVVTSGVATVAELQGKGYAYLKVG
jgi:intracellular sulfur oxidation DsrE/DsrF family protein